MQLHTSVDVGDLGFRLRVLVLFSESDDSHLATDVNYGVASFSIWSNSTCNFKTCIRRIKALRLLSPLKGEHLEQVLANTYLSRG